MLCISNLASSQFRGPAQVGMGLCLVTAVAVSLIGALGLAQIPFLNTLSQSACIALCASGGGFSLVFGGAFTSLISHRKPRPTHSQEVVSTASVSYDSGPPPPSRKKKSSEIEKNTQEETLSSCSREISVDQSSSQENGAIVPFQEVFKNAYLQQYFFESGHFSFSALIHLSTTCKAIREPFIAFPSWRVKILQRLIFNKALDIGEDHYDRNAARFYTSYEIAKSDVSRALEVAKDLYRSYSILFGARNYSNALHNIGMAWAANNAATPLFEIVKLLPSYERNRVLDGYAAQQAASGNVEEALETAKFITDTWDRHHTIVDIAARQACRDEQGARETLKIIKSSSHYHSHLRYFNSKKYKLLYAQARKTTTTSHRHESSLIDSHLNSCNFKTTLETAQSITDVRVRDDALQAIVPIQVRTDIQGALETAKTIKDESLRDKALQAIVPIQVRTDIQGALETAKTIKYASLRDKALQAIVPIQVRTDIQGALETAKTIKYYEALRGQALVVVACEQAKTDLKKSIKILRRIKKVYYWDLRECALEQIKGNNLRVALLLSNCCKMPSAHRAKLLASIASRCTVANLPAVEEDKVIEGYFHLVNGPKFGIISRLTNLSFAFNPS